jgi:hypothetical protein
VRSSILTTGPDDAYVQSPIPETGRAPAPPAASPGHPARSRAAALAMHEPITAVHPAVTAAMTHLDRDTEPRLERIVSQLRAQAKLDARC